MKIALLIGSIFLLACGGAYTETKTDSAATLSDTVASTSNNSTILLFTSVLVDLFSE